MQKNLTCPLCNGKFPVYANPSPTTDVIVHAPGRGVVIIARANIPLGYAIPGGFIDEGEWVEDAAIREMKEETNLDVVLDGLLGVYSRPDRDPRHHTMTTVFVGHPVDPDALRAGDDAGAAAWYDPHYPPQPMCFDHGVVLADFCDYLEGRRQLGGLSREWLDTVAGHRNVLRAGLAAIAAEGKGR